MRTRRKLRSSSCRAMPKHISSTCAPSWHMGVPRVALRFGSASVGVFCILYDLYTTDRHELGNHLVDDEPATGFTAVRALPISVLRSSSRIAVRMTRLVARLQDEFTTKLAECQAHIDRCATYAAARTHAACSVRHTSRNICAETRPHLRRDRKRSMCPSASGRGVVLDGDAIAALSPSVVRMHTAINGSGHPAGR